MSAPKNFSQAVLALIKSIPVGRVVTYGQLASVLHRPQASRAVGNALKRNPCLVIVPCHRVVRSDGSLGGYVGGSRQKIALLQKEGVNVKNNRLVDWPKVQYTKLKLKKSHDA